MELSGLRHQHYGSQCFVQKEVDGQEEIVPCESWTYDTSVFHYTVSMEFDLVCDRAWISPLFQTIYTAGNFFGAILGAVISDKYGRRMSMRIGSFLSAFFLAVMLLVPWLSVVMLARFLAGTFFGAMIYPVFMLVMEGCEPKVRSTVGILLALPYATMMMGLAGISYAIRTWRLLQAALCFPYLCLLPLVIIIDESPRWLMVTGHLEEAVKVFQRAFRLNKTKLPEGMDLVAVVNTIHKKLTLETTAGTTPHEENIDSTEIQQHVACEIFPDTKEILTSSNTPRATLGLEDGFGHWWAGPVALFRTPVVRKLMLVLISVRLLQGMAYVGLPLNSGTFSSPFLYMAMMGAAEVPAYTLTIPITNRLGRKKVLMPCLTGCGVSLFIYLILREVGVTGEWFHMMLVLISYLLVCTAYQVNFMFAPELLPTTLRPWGTASCILATYVGFSITPFITDKASGSLSWLPSAIFGTCGIVAGTLVFFLPETHGRDLPETVADLRSRMDEEKRPLKRKIPQGDCHYQQDALDRPEAPRGFIVDYGSIGSPPDDIPASYGKI